jgi:hypothetical protein
MNIRSLIQEGIILEQFDDILSLNKKLSLIESIIAEEVVQSKKVMDTGDSIKYRFDLNGIKYEVSIWHDSRKHNGGVFEVEFSVPEQKHSGHRVGKDLKHLNSVLQTVSDIVEREVKEKGIRTIKMEGATGEQDIDGDTSIMGALKPTVRAKLYNRFLSNRYGADAVDAVGRYMTIDMTKVFPEIFKGKEESNADKLINLLVRISDANPDEAGIRRGLDGGDLDNSFSIDTDYIESEEHGAMYFTIEVNEPMGLYEVRWEKFDTGDEHEQDFNSFEEIYNYISQTFL